MEQTLLTRFSIKFSPGIVQFHKNQFCNIFITSSSLLEQERMIIKSSIIGFSYIPTVIDSSVYLLCLDVRLDKLFYRIFLHQHGLQDY